MARKSRKRYSSSKEETKEVNGKAEAVSSTNDAVNTSSDTKTNDPEWYARDPQLLRDASRIPFSTPFGAQLGIIKGGTSYGVGFSDDTHVGDYLSAIPGVCSLKLKPTFGRQLDKNDPANVCANSFYTFVRYLNSGRKNYDPADLFIYASTMADIYSFVVFAQRLYNYCYMLSQRNYYIAEALIKANGFDPAALCSSLANFRYWLNSYIAKVQSFAVPADIYFFKRRAFLYANFYTENQFGNLKDQLYQFIPAGFYKFELDTTNNSAGCLKFKSANWSLANLGALITYGNDLLSNITGDEDFGLMSGDILKAYGANGIIMLGSVPEEGGILPIYDPWVLSQFKNASIIVPDNTSQYTVGSYTFTYGNLYQDANGNLVCREILDNNVSFNNNAVHLANDKLLTVENPEPAEGDVIESTRLMCAVKNGSIGIESGTEIVVGVFIYLFRSYGAYTSNFTRKVLDHTVHTSNVILVKPIDASVNNWDCNVSTDELLSINFKYAPNRFIGVISSNGQKLQNIFPMCNLDNTTIVTNEQLSRLHECSLLSLFYVPGVAKLI